MRDFVIDGKRLEIPQEIPEAIANLIKRCWNHQPSERPSMQEVEELLDSLLHKEESRPHPKKEEIGLVGYHGRISKETAEDLLSGTPRGTFLTRWDFEKKCFILSVSKGENEVQHMVLDRSDGNNLLDRVEKLRDSLQLTQPIYVGGKSEMLLGSWKEFFFSKQTSKINLHSSSSSLLKNGPAQTSKQEANIKEEEELKPKVVSITNETLQEKEIKLNSQDETQGSFQEQTKEKNYPPRQSFNTRTRSSSFIDITSVSVAPASTIRRRNSNTSIRTLAQQFETKAKQQSNFSRIVSKAAFEHVPVRKLRSNFDSSKN